MEFKYIKMETYISETHLKDLQKSLQEADAGHQPDSFVEYGVKIWIPVEGFIMAKAFTAEMVAPCGLDCSICSQALSDKKPCPGCNGPTYEKPIFCAEWCGIIRCEKRKSNGFRYCDECPDYPCEDVMEKETRYTSAYPRRESPLENLIMIRDEGMETFLKYEREQWTCETCGGTICVHTGTCSVCGK